jgi:8-oxo-dGTP pyrophosphatase MutT (NUDIX family)
MYLEVIMKRESSRAIIIEDGKLLCIFRRKIDDQGHKSEYYVIPGGGIEKGETKRETVLRELKEELDIDIEIVGYLGMIERETSIDHYYVAKRINGEPHISGEESERMSERNYYEPMFMDINNLKNVDFICMDFVEKALKEDFIDE